MHGFLQVSKEWVRASERRFKITVSTSRMLRKPCLDSGFGVSGYLDPVPLLGYTLKYNNREVLLMI